MPPPPPSSSPVSTRKSTFHPATLFQNSSPPNSTSSASSTTRPYTPYAIIILNQPINFRTYALLSAHASLILCADGGANHWHDQFYSSPTATTPTRLRYPDAIIGDLDSLRPGVREALSAQGVAVIEDGDQYSTDFGKCLKYVRSWDCGQVRAVAEAGNGNMLDDEGRGDWDGTEGHGGHNDAGKGNEDVPMDIVVLSTLSGRVDQAMSTLHHLYTATAENEHAEGGDSNDDKTRDGITHTQPPTPNVDGQTEQQQQLSQPQRPQQPQQYPAHQRPRRKTRAVKLGKTYLLTPSSLSFILDPGVNEIHFPPGTIEAPAPDNDDTASSLNTNSTTTNPSPPFPSKSSSNQPLFTPNIGVLPLAQPCDPDNIRPRMGRPRIGILLLGWGC